MIDFLKVIFPATYEGKKVFCNIRFKGGNLSITGVVNPRKNGNADSCGQILDVLLEGIQPNLSEGWTNEMINKLYNVWSEWHLNDLIAGSPRQEDFLKSNYRYDRYDYELACGLLSAADLLEDKEYLINGKPYRYGTGWLRKEVPEDVYQWLSLLPSSSVKPAWV